MPETLRAAVVGCGAIANIRHIPAFLKLKGTVTLEAVCDKNEQLARETARKFSVPKVYADIADLLEQAKPDIIDICTPPQIHAPLTIQALEGGAHVILEKPMALKTSDCDAIIEAAERSGRKVGVVHNQLFYPPVARARQLVAQGAIGDFIGMRIYMSDPRDEMIMREDYWIHKLPGGVIGETGPHPVYKSIAFIGNVKDVAVRASRRIEHAWAPYDEFRIDLEGEKGYSSIVISYSSERRASTMDIMGTEGSLHLDLLSMLVYREGKFTSLGPAALAGRALGAAGRITKGVIGNALSVVTGRGEFYGHNTIIKQFVESITRGGDPPITGADGRETVRTLEMIVAKIQGLKDTE